MVGKPNKIGGSKMDKKWQDRFKYETKEDTGPYPDEEVEPINTYLTGDLDGVITGPDKGQQEEGTYATLVNKTDDGYVVDLPDELLEKMEWKPGDIIEVSLTENLFDEFEVMSITLRNLSIERDEDRFNKYVVNDYSEKD